MSVRCPHCDCRIPFSPRLHQGQIFSSGGIALNGEIDDRLAAAEATAGTRLYAYYLLSSFTYTIVGCSECRKEFIVQASPPPQRVVWPILTVTIPSEIPEEVRRAFIEAKQAHAIGADTVALLGARTALIRMQRDQKCAKLNNLAEQGRILNCWPAKRTS